MEATTARPTRYCSVCGEYVADRYDTVGGRTIKRLVHISADGERIHRSHVAKEEDPSICGSCNRTLDTEGHAQGCGNADYCRICEAQFDSDAEALECEEMHS